MEPLGGDLFIDQFCETRRAAQAVKPAPRPAPRAAPARPPAQAAPAAPAPRPERDEANVSDSGRLRAEVDAYMNRDSIESTDDSEIQEFLKEKSGFNPSDLE